MDVYYPRLSPVQDSLTSQGHTDRQAHRHTHGSDNITQLFGRIKYEIGVNSSQINYINYFKQIDFYNTT